MEFKEKIQNLRSKYNLTQEQLSEKLYVSRTAVSKWESGKGYPNIDTLKDISKLFNVTIDDLLSSEEIINIAEEEQKITAKKTNKFVYGLLDVVSILFIFLPIYANKVNDFIYSVPLINSNGTSVTIKILYMILLSILSLIGIIEIILNFIDNNKIQKVINKSSLHFQVISILIFAFSRQAYLTNIVFVLLIIKVILLFRNISNKKDIF